MSNFFNVENPFFQILNKIVDMVMLSFFWCVFCIPTFFVGMFFKASIDEGQGISVVHLVLLIIALIPVGPVTTALYYAIVKVIRRERGYALREFFKSFKTNFKQGMLVCLIMGTLGAILYIDYDYINAMEAEEGSTLLLIMRVAFNVVSLLSIFLLTFIFPVLSRFQLSLKHLFKNSMIMAIRHLLTTILLILTVAVFALACWLLWPYPTFFIFPGLCCLVCSFLIERVFKRYMPKPEETPEESGEDQWYLE